MGIVINMDELAEITKLVLDGFESERRLGLLACANKQMECIKRVRQATGLGLQEAHDLVDAALSDEDPVVRVARRICTRDPE